MLSVIAGIVLIIAAIVLWLGNLTIAHALAIFIGVFGILLLAWWGAPNAWARRT